MSDNSSRLLTWLCFLSLSSPLYATSLNNIYSKLIESARTNSATYKLAQEELKQSDSHEHTNFTKLLPSIKASLIKEFNPDQRDLGTQDESRVELDLNYPVYNKRNLIRYDLSKAQKEFNINKLALTETDLVLATKNLFGAYLVAIIKTNFYMISIKRATQNYEYISKGYKLGRNSKLDFLRAKANLDILLAQLNQELLLKNQSKERLLNFLSISSPPYDEIEFQKAFSDPDKILDMIDSFTRNEPLYEKFKIIQKRITLEKDSLSLKGLPFEKNKLQEKLDLIKAENLRGDEWISFDVKASLINTADKLSSLTGGKSYNEVKVGAYLTIPLFSFGSSFSTRNELANAKKSAQIKRYQNDTQLINSIYREAENIKTLRSSIDMQRLLIQKNKEIADLSLKSYKLKRSDLQDLLTSENNLLNSKAKLIEDKIRLSSLLRGFLFKLGEPFED